MQNCKTNSIDIDRMDYILDLNHDDDDKGVPFPDL